MATVFQGFLVWWSAELNACSPEEILKRRFLIASGMIRNMAGGWLL